jgi:DNA-binding NarL/FixJ family response regulator
VSACSTQTATVRALVISQHDAVRRQLVAYLARSPGLSVTGERYAAETIRNVNPRVLVLDLSRIDRSELAEAIDAASQVGARLIALASIREPVEEHTVTDAGGIYRLKAVGADGLAETVLAAAERPPVHVPV